MKNNVLVVAAHPDDEILGAGGTILKHKDAGDTINILILGDGESARDESINIKKRARQAERVGEKIGVKNLILEKLPDNQFDSIPLLQITKMVETHLFKFKPSIVYTHFAHDLNIDHRLTFEAVLTTCRPQPNFFVKKILSFEILSSTEWQQKTSASLFCPNEYSDISKYIKQKITLMKLYKDELRDFPHPRSEEGIRTLARYRGMETGLEYAEAFQIVRMIQN